MSHVTTEQEAANAAITRDTKASEGAPPRSRPTRRRRLIAAVVVLVLILACVFGIPGSSWRSAQFLQTTPR